MPNTVDVKKRMPRGAMPSPRHVLAAAMPFIRDEKMAAPASFLMWPCQMSYWDNSQYGDCVSAEEAFAKATAAPQVFIPQAAVVAWASANGYLNGAYLVPLMRTMQTDGFPLNNMKYNDGPHYAVDWTNPATLQSAIYSYGPVKIGVGAEYFQGGGGVNGYVTPGTSGWAMYNYPTPPYPYEDHCVSLCGYGTLAELVSLFKQQGVTVNAPSGMPTGLCYALFTWDSIGIIDAQSMLNMTYEAWIRDPVTVVTDSVSMPYLIWQNNGNGAWNWFGELPDGAPPVPFFQIATGSGNGGNLQVIGLGANDALPYLIWQSNANGVWNWYGKLPNPSNPVPFCQVATGVGNGGNLQAIGIGANDGLPYLIWQNKGNGAWNWYGELPNTPPTGVTFSQVATGPGSGGDLQVVTLGTDGLPYLIWQNNANGAWNWYGALPNASNPVRFLRIATGVGSGGNLQVIGLGSDGVLYLIWQNKTNGAWNWYGALPNASSPVTFSQIATGVGNGGNLQVIGIGANDGLPYLTWQNNANGAWNWYGKLPNASNPVTFAQIATGVGSGGNLQVIGLGANDGLPYLIWEGNGAWNWYGALQNGGFALSQIATGIGSGSNLQVIVTCR